jgi:hypothetical protein
MEGDPVHWTYLVALIIKLLAKFGLIPGFIAAFGSRIRKTPSSSTATWN